MFIFDDDDDDVRQQCLWNLSCLLTLVMHTEKMLAPFLY